MGVRVGFPNLRPEIGRGHHSHISTCWLTTWERNLVRNTVICDCENRNNMALLLAVARTSQCKAPWIA